MLKINLLIVRSNKQWFITMIQKFTFESLLLLVLEKKKIFIYISLGFINNIDKLV